MTKGITAPELVRLDYRLEFEYVYWRYWLTVNEYSTGFGLSSKPYTVRIRLRRRKQSTASTRVPAHGHCMNYRW